MLAFAKLCSLKEHTILEVIDSDLISVVDFTLKNEMQNAKKHQSSKLFNVNQNKLSDLPGSYLSLPRERTFATSQTAFSLKAPQQQLKYHYEQFENEIEIINHDCVDFVFYHKGEQIKVLSLVEKNDQYVL
jgi:hypothetical protein